MQDFRVIDLPERTTLDASDYTMIDSAENGTNKYLLSRQAAETDAKIAAAVGGVEEDLNAAVEGIEENITALQGDVETVETTLGTKADTDGTYPDMAVGSVLGTNTVTDREPYFLRPSASIGDREFDTLVGGTLGWNQLANEIHSTHTAGGVTLTKTDSGKGTITGTATENTSLQVSDALIPLTKDHIYLIPIVEGFTGSSTNRVTMSGVPLSGYNGGVFKNTQGYSGLYIRIDFYSGCVFNVTDYNHQCFDLTTLFGTTIADYIYSLEQATAGAGVAWVRKYLPNTYYAYCAPTLKHVTGVSAHVLRDANNNIIGNYALDSTWVGMGIPKLDSDGKLYFDGDRYSADGTVTENALEVNLGNLNWGLSDGSYFYASIGGKMAGNHNLICAKYATTAGAYVSEMTDKQIKGHPTSDIIYIKDSAYSDAASFKTSLANVMCVYITSTPTTSTATPFTNPQICDKNGTEEYVTTGLVPVGHETEYVENLADKLTDIPDLPTTAGTYSLKVTVSGGVPSYSWVNA